MHIMQAMFTCLLLKRIDMHRIREPIPPIVAERRIVVQRDLGVQRTQRLGRFVIWITDLGKRVDLNKRSVIVFEALPHLQQNLCGLINIGMVETNAFSHFGGRFEVEILKRVNMQTLDGFRMLLSDLLNLSTAIRCGKHIEITGGTIHGNGDIVLVKNVLCLGYQHAANLVLVNGHRQDAFGCKNSLIAILRQLDTASLTAMTNLHLSLDHIGVANLIGSLSHFVRVLREHCFRRWNTLLFKQLPSLILIEIHGFFFP